jgi:hypothetical protein
MDGAPAVIINLTGDCARVCYLTPDKRLSYIAANYLLVNLKPMPQHRSCTLH